MIFDLNRGKTRSLKELLFAGSTNKIKGKELYALNDISFNIEDGEIFGIIGNNGAGKSTLLKILAGIMKPTHGSVAIEGIIAPMIELGTGFDYELSAYENIYLSGAVLGFSKDFVASKIVEIFDFSELWEFKDVAVKYFSSGMIARLAFAVSTIVTPDILIVDEVLSVGDLAFQRKSLKKMMDLMKSGATVIYVSHDIDSIASICDRVLWLEQGKIRQIGIAQEICNNYKENISI